MRPAPTACFGGNQGAARRGCPRPVSLRPPGSPQRSQGRQSFDEVQVWRETACPKVEFPLWHNLSPASQGVLGALAQVNNGLLDWLRTCTIRFQIRPLQVQVGKVACIIKRSFNGREAYCNSKLTNALFTCELSRRLDSSRVTANFLHPGTVATKLLHVFRDGGGTVESGAETPVHLALAPEVARVTGRYFVNRRLAPA